MADNDTLLAHLSPWFTTQTENIAVEALGYILKKSQRKRRGFRTRLTTHAGLEASYRFRD